MSCAKHLLRPAALLGLLSAPLLNGCLATYGVQTTEMEAAFREDIRLLQEENQRLKGRLEGFDLELERLQRATEALHTAPAGPSVAEVQALQQRLAAVETQLRALDAARERDRKEIIDTLSSKLAPVVSAKPRPTSNPAPARRAATQEGYEHIVESGQTLSAIAAAYNVSPKAIIDANNLTNPNSLRVGQKLFIPAP